MGRDLLSSESVLALRSGAVVNLVTWSLLVISVLAMCARALATWNSFKRFHGDDILALVALVRRPSYMASNHLVTDSR